MASKRLLSKTYASYRRAHGVRDSIRLTAEAYSVTREEVCIAAGLMKSYALELQTRHTMNVPAEEVYGHG